MIRLKLHSKRKHGIARVQTASIQFGVGRLWVVNLQWTQIDNFFLIIFS